MIRTVTMNPAVDKTAHVTALEIGGLNRLSGLLRDAGGKGINVSKTIAALGGQSVATGFLGGTGGAFIERELADCPGIQADFVFVDGETRSNLKVVEQTGRVTELNEPGPAISSLDLAALQEKIVASVGSGDLVVLAGSVPSGVSADSYRILTDACRQRGAQVILDADGPLFHAGLPACPTAVKPNRNELERYFRLGHRADTEELIRMGRELLFGGVELVAISLGGEGALFLQGKQVLTAAALPVEARSTVGAGDAMVAALAYSLHANMPFEDCARLAMACSAGAVTTEGTKPASRSLVDQLLDRVELRAF